MSKNLVFYYIAASTGGANPTYTVTQNGVCRDAGVVDCHFATTLAPDQPGGKYSRAYLLANGVIIEIGKFTNE